MHSPAKHRKAVNMDLVRGFSAEDAFQLGFRCFETSSWSFEDAALDSRGHSDQEPLSQQCCQDNY